MSSDSPRIVVLISGTGTNLQALIDQADIRAHIVGVISNKKAAYGLTRAKNAGIQTHYHNLLSYTKGVPAEEVQEARLRYDADLAQLILKQRPDLIVCAGWMHIFSPTALAPLEKAGVDIINLHPALPGQFDGINAIGRAYEAFQKGEIDKTGIMVHWVIAQVDRGEPLIVREVEMRSGESKADLEERIHEVEHVAIVEGTRMVLKERARRKEKEGAEMDKGREDVPGVS